MRAIFGFKERNGTLGSTLCCSSKEAKEQQSNGPSELEFLQLQLKPYKWYHRICPPRGNKRKKCVKNERKKDTKCIRNGFTIQLPSRLALHSFGVKEKNTAHTYWLHNAAGSVEYFERLAFEFEVFIVKCVKNVSAWMRACVRASAKPTPTRRFFSLVLVLLFSHVSGFQTDFQPTI